MRRTRAPAVLVPHARHEGETLRAQEGLAGGLTHAQTQEPPRNEGKGRAAAEPRAAEVRGGDYTHAEDVLPNAQAEYKVMGTSRHSLPLSVRPISNGFVATEYVVKRTGMEIRETYSPMCPEPPKRVGVGCEKLSDAVKILK